MKGKQKHDERMVCVAPIKFHTNKGNNYIFKNNKYTVQIHTKSNDFCYCFHNTNKFIQTINPSIEQMFLFFSSRTYYY